MMKENPLLIWDISPAISSALAVFPGDCAFSRKESLSFAQGHHLALSSMETTLHLGAHADSESHYHKEGAGIEKRPLDAYLGLCEVVSAPADSQGRIQPLKRPVRAPRVLFRTNSFPHPEVWVSDFHSLSAPLLEELAQQGVVLVGIDTPSVDPAESKDLEAHQMLWKHHLAVLEGLVLDKIEPGLYDLVALPLAITGGDASPVRAVLFPAGTIQRSNK
jgi:arylformamidase